MTDTHNLPFQSGFGEMDESFKANRWGSGPSDQGVRNVFTRYASGNQASRQQVETTMRSGGGAETYKRYVSQVSHVSQPADGFRKMKYNQMETLKELRQQYQILRNLPLQDEFLKHSHTKKQSTSQYDSRHGSESISSSSKQTDKKKRRESSSNTRNNQILTLEKRQLQLVIGNSMRKIQQLLNSEIEYKKIIHQLQLQLDSRSGDQKLENLSKTMKRNEADLNERIQNLKRDIERLKQINKQLQDKVDLLQAELLAKNQDLKKARDEKRSIQDMMRLEKDKYLNLQIDIKRIRMQSEIMEKDKNNEINRLKGLIETQPKDLISGNEVRRLEDDLRAQKQKYEMLLHEFERYKREVSERPRQVPKDTRNDDQMRLFEALIAHLREESVNQNRASMDLISSMVAKLDEKNDKNQKRRQKQKSPQKGSGTDNKLLEQLFHLRNEVSSLRKDKDDDKSSPMINNLAESMAEYQNKIIRLQQQITDGSITKENLLKEYEILKSTFQYSKQEYEKLNAQYQKLRDKLNQTEHEIQYSNEEFKSRFREKEAQYEDTIRQLKRQLDEALFMVDKAKKEGEFGVGLLRGENESAMRLLREQLSRVEGEKELLRVQITKMKTYFEAKILQKNNALEKTASDFQTLCQTKEQTLVAYKSNSEKEMNDLIRKIEGMAELNQRYLMQSAQVSSYERQLHELRFALKKMKGINDGVDHLWQVKETEYYNVNRLLQELRAQ